ncbi:MAG: hypothetical protein M1549_02035 [Candidatus Dependentiae bacterium]|nr:hypothetical protein [Candidatus Dependentiae bacterium]
MRLTRTGINLVAIFSTVCIAGLMSGIAPGPAEVKRIFIDRPADVLGYDPDTDRIAEADGQSPLGRTVVLCLHGFGDSKYSPNAFSPHAPSVKIVPENVRRLLVSFNFRDHREWWGLPLARLRHTNLGGEPDARVVLFHIIKCYCRGYENIVLFGHSRGCAAGIRALDMCVHPSAYRETWKALGFATRGNGLDLEKIRAIQSAIGRIYLARPLLDIHHALLMAGQRAVGTLFAPVAAAVLRRAASSLADCSLQASEPIELLRGLLVEVPFDFYLFFAPNDAVVGNPHDDLVMGELAHNPKNVAQLHAQRTGETHFEFRDAAVALGEYLMAL